VKFQSAHKSLNAFAASSTDLEAGIERKSDGIKARLDGKPDIGKHNRLYMYSMLYADYFGKDLK